MSVERSGRAGGRVRARWQLDFTSRAAHSPELVSPPGYSASASNVTREDISRSVRHISRSSSLTSLHQGGRPKPQDQAELGPRPWPLQTGPDESVHHVDVRQHHFNISHHDGLHDDVQVTAPAL